MNSLNGQRVIRRANTIFVPLPQKAWRSAGICDCDHCKGSEGFWDTLAITENPELSKRKGWNDTTWTVHAPEFQPQETQALAHDVYYSVLIPFVEAGATEWHPTGRRGPFSILSRGSFTSEAEAHKWAADHLRGSTYSVRRYDAV
jgi:hypothetical protein